MTTLRKVLPLLLLLSFVLFPQGKQNNLQTGVLDASASNWKFPTRTFANLPAAASSTGLRFTVTDCVTSACTAGSGALRQDMVSTGSAWIPAVSSSVVTDAAGNVLLVGSGKITAPDGTAMDPPYSFTNFPTYGFFFDQASGLAYSHSNNESVIFLTQGLKVRSDGGMQWASGALPNLSDTSLYRLSAATLALGNGTAGSFAGSLKLTSIATSPVATSALPVCVATTGTPWRASVNDALAPALGVVLASGGAAFANVHCSLTTGTYIVDGI